MIQLTRMAYHLAHQYVINIHISFPAITPFTHFNLYYIWCINSFDLCADPIELVIHLSQRNPNAYALPQE